MHAKVTFYSSQGREGHQRQRSWGGNFGVEFWRTIRWLSVKKSKKSSLGQKCSLFGGCRSTQSPGLSEALWVIQYDWCTCVGHERRSKSGTGEAGRSTCWRDLQWVVTKLDIIFETAGANGWLHLRLNRFIPKIPFYQKHEECMGKAKIRGQETRGRAIESWCLRLSELKQWKQS